MQKQTDNLNLNMVNTKELQKRLKAFEEDRYCPNGCVEYQLDKINMYKEYFGEIREHLIMFKSMYLMDVDKNGAKLDSINYMIEICNTALNGSRWV